VRPLLARALRDPSARVRRALAEAAGVWKADGAVHALGAALDSRDEVVRRRAAEALGYLGDENGCAYLIAKWEGRSGDFPRSYFAQMRQVSYIQDYDVEVA
jgi:HEAT repeat protein